ncbi:phosphonate C-P lyase system protein PhnG [Bradyrhizobium sp. B120]|uniref:phosphonate C-P lyase system protein PhnG n=1 Tax=Bradyrhizobium sp. B120 TaxID=3410088 RepID=UPI003B97D8B5
MTLLAKAPIVELDRHWAAIARPNFQWIRRPEYGAAKLRGAVGRTGAVFNIGETTVTRCTLQIETGEIGIVTILTSDDPLQGFLQNVTARGPAQRSDTNRVRAARSGLSLTTAPGARNPPQYAHAQPVRGAEHQPAAAVERDCWVQSPDVAFGRCAQKQRRRMSIITPLVQCGRRPSPDRQRWRDFRGWPHTPIKSWTTYAATTWQVPAVHDAKDCATTCRDSLWLPIPGALACTEKREYRNVLLPNGDVTLCCMDFERRHVLGNLLHDEYEDLIKGPGFRQVADRMNGASGSLLCRMCERVTPKS